MPKEMEMKLMMEAKRKGWKPSKEKKTREMAVKMMMSKRKGK